MLVVLELGNRDFEFRIDEYFDFVHDPVFKMKLKHHFRNRISHCH